MQGKIKNLKQIVNEMKNMRYRENRFIVPKKEINPEKRPQDKEITK